MEHTPKQHYLKSIILTAAVVGVCSIINLTWAKYKGEQYGPFDYYKASSASITLVERAHFSVKTFEFARTKQWCAYWRDVDYTLRVFPNHPVALVKMAEFLKKHRACPEQTRKKKQSLEDLINEIDEGDWKLRTPEFYYEKGISYQPQYPETRVLYAKYLYEANKLNSALETLTQAEKIEPKSPDVHYYLGLVYLKKRDIGQAKQHTDEAYKLGYKSQDLKDNLAKSGKSKEKK